MTSAERIQPYIVAQHRISSGLPTPLDPQLAMDDPELVTYAKAEIDRLTAKGRRTLAEHDHESKIRYRALLRMVTAHEEAA